jgi:tetratricopeptide (TPR) repeat protein
VRLTGIKEKHQALCVEFVRSSSKGATLPEALIYRRFCVLIALVLAAGSTSAQTPQDRDPQFQIQVDVTGKVQKEKRKDQWGEVRSKNFVVAGDADDKDLQTAASELEQFRSDFARLFPRANATSSVATRVIVFRDRQSLRAHRPQGDDASEPYFQGATDINYIVLSAGDKLSGNVVRGYARALMRDSLSTVPLWLETGIVEFFSAYKLMRLGSERVVKLGLDEYKGISEKDLLPMAILMNMDQDSLQTLDKQIQKTFHVQSCLLFQYLLQTRRLGAMMRMTHEMAEGRPLEDAFRTIFRLPAATVLQNLKNHVKMSKFGGWSVNLAGLTLDPGKHSVRVSWGRGAITLPLSFDSLRAETEGLPVRIISDAEANAYRGDLHLHTGRFSEAETLLRQAIREDPTLAWAHASLGFVQALQKNYRDAHRSLDKARVLDPGGNALGYYYAAWTAREEARSSGNPLTSLQLEDMEAALLDAISVTPEFVPAVEMLAETEFLNQRDLNTPARRLLDAMKKSPGRESLLILLARISSAGGEKASAGWMLQRVIASGSTTTEQKKEARTLYADLNLTAAQKTAFATFEINEGAGAGRGADTKIISKADIKDAVARDKETKVVRGYLTEVRCVKGLTLYIRIGAPNIDERIENLHSDSAKVDWVDDSGEQADAVKCEKLPAPVRVAITYRPKRKGLMMGEPLAVEFCRGGGSFDCDVRQPPPPVNFP